MIFTTLLLDTDVLIDYLREVPSAVDFLEQQLDSTLYVSVVTVTELYAGVRNNDERKKIDLLLLDFTILTVNAQIAAIAGTMKQQYGKSHGTGIADAIIAATSQVYSLPLLTLNTKHFPMLSGVQSPYVKS